MQTYLADQLAADGLPVLIIPGLSGSTIKNPATDRKLWINLFILGALKRYLGGIYDHGNKKVDGVITPVEIPEGIEGLTLAYCGDLITALSSSGVSAAGYDWRFAPQEAEFTKWVLRVQEEVQLLRNAYGNKKVVILGHSMGNPMTVKLLQSLPQWAEQNIAGYIAVVPPFGGSGMTLRAITSGITLFQGLEIGPSIFRNFPCIGFLFPYANTFGTREVACYDGKSFTADTLGEFLQILPKIADDEHHYEVFEHIVKPHRPHEIPEPPANIPVWLITSQYEQTAIGVAHVNGKWENIMEEDNPIKKGDGIVPYDSLHAYDGKWNFVEKIEIPDVDHGKIIHDLVFIEHVQRIIGQLARQHAKHAK